MSVRLRNSLLPFSVLCLIALGLLVLSVSLGAVDIGFSETASILWSRSSGELWQRVVVFDVRLPRAIIAAVGGAGLAVAGALLQGAFRNPLADPGVLGVSSGASLGAVLALYFIPVDWAVYAVPIAAFVAALLTVALVYRVGVMGGRSIASFILAGVALGGLASALTSLVLALSLSEWEVGREMIQWLMGGLDGRTYSHVWVVVPPTLLALLLAWPLLRSLDGFALGDEGALAVGVDVDVVRRRTVAVSALLTASAVAVMGVVGFVGLVVPHVARLVVGPRHRVLALTSAAGGAALTLGADLLCRSVGDGALRLGVVTALIGGPFFLYLLLREGSWERAR